MRPTHTVDHHTLSELFRHNDWGNGKILSLARDLSDAQLDQRFEMGLGSLRATLHHLWAVEQLWFERWCDNRQGVYDAFDPGISVANLAHRFASTADQRNALLRSLDAAGLSAAISYTSLRGETYTQALGMLMLHVCNHGVHHRAQCVNMLRHAAGATPRPGLDYIFHRLEEPGAAPPALRLASIRAYFAYSDWARRALDAAVDGLDDAALDRRFEMGMCTLRQTLLHLHAAEQWWFGNWMRGPGEPFPVPDPATSIAVYRAQFEETAAARDAFIAGCSDAQLIQPVHGEPRPGVRRTFPLGCTMLQLCCHGTHHRAQAMNMLRRLGVAPPALDLALWDRETGFSPT